MNSATMTIRMDGQLRSRLEKLAKATHRTKSFLAAEAIKEYVSLQEWQTTEIKRGIAEADNGDLVSHDTLVNYWERKRANLVDNKNNKKS